ncbi:hypothetical protein B296_00040652, partial [Ensete ventricosum]
LRSRTDTAERTVTDLACSSSSVAGQIQLILVNNCNYSVWPSTLGNAGHLTPKDGGFHCMGKWGAPPASVVEMTFGTAPLLRNEPADVTACCPAEFEVRRGRRVVGCKSACLSLKADEYCCTGRYGSPTSCQPTRLSHLFKSHMPSCLQLRLRRPVELEEVPRVALPHHLLPT